jgi:uncharacterized protein YyaL (SSP411 family)
VDNAWIVPHFEKMLYNQARLALVYTRAYQLTRRALYRRIAQQTLDYVLGQMQGKNGGFFSATDADSAGKEGSFFVWSVDEIKNNLSENDFKKFNRWFDLSANTEFEGDFIIRFKDLKTLKIEHYAEIDALLKQLYKLRMRREKPLTDDKILLAWNALLIPSLMEAGTVFSDNRYTQAGVKLAHFLSNFQQSDQLYRAVIDNKLTNAAVLEDYVYLANAYLSVYDATRAQIWLDKAADLMRLAQLKFWDKKRFGFAMSENNRHLPTTQKKSADDALPAANAVAYQVLNKLKNRIISGDFKTQARQLLDAFSAKINQNPQTHSSFILAIENAETGLSNVQYAYNGRIRIQTQRRGEGQIRVNLSLKPRWHINANQVLQTSLIATEIENLDRQNWAIKTAIYPTAELLKLGFSTQKIAVYQGDLQIKLNLKKLTANAAPVKLALTLQACSDKVCLSPKRLILNP